MTMFVMVAGDRHPVPMSKNCLRAQEDLDKKKVKAHLFQGHVVEQLPFTNASPFIRIQQKLFVNTSEGVWIQIIVILNIALLMYSRSIFLFNVGHMLFDDLSPLQYSKTLSQWVVLTAVTHCEKLAVLLKVQTWAVSEDKDFPPSAVSDMQLHWNRLCVQRVSKPLWCHSCQGTSAEVS